MKIGVLILAIFCQSFANGANILGVFPIPGKSHYMAGATFMKILAEAGHNVTVISPFGEKNPPKNYRDVIVESMFSRGPQMNMFDMENSNPLISAIFMTTMSTLLHPVMGSKGFQDFLAEDQHFDIVLVEQFFTNDYFKFLAWKYNAHLVLLSALDASSWTNPFVANPSPPSYIPELPTSYTTEMSFFQRVTNFIITIINEMSLYYFVLPKSDAIVHEYYPEAPSLSTIAFNNSLVFLNGDPSVGFPLPKVPNMVDVGGYHINPPKELPKDLKTLLDGSKHGVIYFSMGSNLKSANMTKFQKDTLINVFSRLKQDVLWKFEDDSLKNLPKNLHIRKWLPQQDILAHKNVKLFITHGGIFSTMEAVYHNVPLLIIPIFGDQQMNAERCRQNGFALISSLKQLNEEDFEWKIKEMLNNPKFKENVGKKSKIMKDQIVPPREKIKFWIDYVMRHNGAHHLQVAGVKLSWYQYLSLDVLAFLFVSISVIFLLIILLLRKLLKLCFKSSSKSKRE